MFWERSPYSTNIASDWLRAVDEEEIKIKMDDGIARFFTRFGRILFYFKFVDLWEAQPWLQDPE